MGIAFVSVGAVTSHWSALREAGTYIAILSCSPQVNPCLYRWKDEQSNYCSDFDQTMFEQRGRGMLAVCVTVIGANILGYPKNVLFTFNSYYPAFFPAVCCSNNATCKRFLWIIAWMEVPLLLFRSSWVAFLSSILLFLHRSSKEAQVRAFFRTIVVF